MGLKVDGKALLVSFSLNEDIDLATNADVELSYFTKGINGELLPITNLKENGNHLVKNKTWAGYLANVNEPAGNYSSGTENNKNYSNNIAKDVLIGSKLQKGYQLGGAMDYVEVTDYSQAPGTYVVKIKVTNNEGKVSKKTVEHTVK